MSSFSRKFSEFIKSSDYPDSRAIVFIDSRINCWDDLVQQAAPEVRVIVLGLMDDGVSAITQILNSSFCREVHLVCLGSPGCIYLGGSELSWNTLIQYESELQNWFCRLGLDAESTAPYPQVYLSGCNVAMGDVGAEFITKLNLITGAAIAASTDVYSSKIFQPQ
ncbi:MAG: DUF4347 domain-containing protein [Waterburya sp.]